MLWLATATSKRAEEKTAFMPIVGPVRSVRTRVLYQLVRLAPSQLENSTGRRIPEKTNTDQRPDQRSADSYDTGCVRKDGHLFAGSGWASWPPEGMPLALRPQCTHSVLIQLQPEHMERNDQSLS
jgi:hypothetical protein